MRLSQVALFPSTMRSTPHLWLLLTSVLPLGTRVTQLLAQLVQSDASAR